MLRCKNRNLRSLYGYPVHRQVSRIAAELRNLYHSRRRQLPKESLKFAQQAETAKEYKLLICKYCDPLGGGDISVPCPTVRHAARQATIHDNTDGVYERERRVNLNSRLS